MKTNSYNIYKESERIKGCVAVQYSAIAESEEQVRELAEVQEIDLSDYTIELERAGVKNELGRPFSPEFRVEF